MNHFFVIRFQRKQRRRLFFLVIFVILTMLGLSYYMTNVKTEQTALIKGNADEKHLALTFNISWGEEKVYDILKLLKKQDVRATFFVSGEWAERHPQILEDITKDKHELGMLGYRYKNYLEQEPDQVRKDMIYARNLFKKLGYEQIRYIRPPSGLFNKDIITLAESLELEVVHWSVASQDWENPGVDTIIENVKQGSNGDIILFHASDIAKQTTAALEPIINDYRKQDFTFVTISQLKDGVIAEESIIE